jgi:glucose-6-phosphate dehydrogenase assembly protein OpcA
MPEAAISTEQPRQEFFGDGIPVAVGQIQRELKKVWQEGQKTAVRASRLNLVIYSAADHSIRANTELVGVITRQHALRAILIASKPRGTGNGVRAWVSAHCQVSKNNVKQRCSEQIAFQLEGQARDLGLIPNIVFSHLDSDLPLYLWWQGEFPEVPDEKLMSWVDHLIYDSAEWKQPAAQYAILRDLHAHTDAGNALGDINWTRLNGLRLAVAQLFDAPGSAATLAALTSIEVSHAAGARLTALLFVGWLAVQLGWKVGGNVAGGGPISFTTPGGGTVSVQLNEGAAGQGIGQIKMQAGDGSNFTVSHEEGSTFFNTSAHYGKDGRDLNLVLPVGAQSTAELVGEELTHSGAHGVYLKTLSLIEPLIG